MATGFRKNGIDLDSIFDAYTTGTHPPATGFLVSGVDINTRYAPLSEGSAALPTGFKISAGADLNTLFAAINSTQVTVATQPGNVSGSTSAGDPHGTVTSGATTCAGGSGTDSYSYTWHIASGSGVSFTAGNSATTGVTGTVSANTTNSGTMYCTISDGISSVDTNTVTWSLQNTTIQTSVGTQPGNVSGATAAGNPNGIVTSGYTSCSGANGTGVYSYQWYVASGSGVSFTNPNSASTAVKGSVDAATTISGTMYCKITDSTGGTINTNTVSWSLQNTSPAHFYFSITAGTGSPDYAGYGPGFGSITDANVKPGYTIVSLNSNISGYTQLEISGSSGPPPSDFLSSLSTNGYTLPLGSATYSTALNNAFWQWATNVGYISGDTYPSAVNF